MDINIKFLVILTMLFCHIVDDYYLQGILADLKQSSWWTENAPQKKYSKDYLIALFMHGFSWSFMVHLPLTVCAFVFGFERYIVIGISCICHAIMHSIVDDLKANIKTINLIQDQLIHIAQIAIIFITIVIL